MRGRVDVAVVEAPYLGATSPASRLQLDLDSAYLYLDGELVGLASPYLWSKVVDNALPHPSPEDFGG